MFVRFGPIIALKSLVDIKKGEEIFSDYLYTYNAPAWYGELRQAHSMKSSSEQKKY